MPSFDSSRSRFRLAEDHLTALGYLAGGKEVPAELTRAADQLLESGLVNEKRDLSIRLAPLVETLAEPSVLVHLEALGADGLLNHGAVVGKNYVFTHESWPGSDESEYVQIEPRSLVWALSRMVNLQSAGSTPDGMTTVVTDLALLDVGLQCLEEISGLRTEDVPGHITDALRSTGRLADADVSGLAALIIELRSSWRMTAAWHGTDEGAEAAQVRGFAVWDCGPLGYWHRESPAEPILPGQVSDETPLKLTAVSPRKVWQMIVDVLPDKGEFAKRQ